MADQTESSKGRATPSRKEAEAARKKQMKLPVSRKDQTKRERVARESARDKQREAMKTGDQRYLPAREQGPVRAFCRDYVDRRRNVAEFLLPFLFLILAFGFIGSGQAWAATATFLLYPVIIVGVILDETVLIRGLRKQLKVRFEPDQVRGATGYSVLRSTQLRRFRLPKPQIKHGEPLKERY